MTSFSDLGLSEKALSAVARMGYSEPTPVQEQAIPLVLEGHDIIAAAQTGTGKTAAFALPAMDTLAHAEQGSGPLMLVVTPTRELAQQIGEVAGQVALSTRHRITTVVGGLSYKPQIDKLRRGTDILIATPGRLIDLMQQQAVRLGDVRVLVLDEADRMLDMGFLPSVKQIVAATPTTRQTLLFSATIDKSIMSIVGSMLRDPKTVEIARKGDVAETVEHFIIRAPQSVKPALIKAVLAEKGANRVIVFARTRSRADSTCRRLRKAGYAVEAIHSDRKQNQRRRALESFASGAVNIITATDVLARGIDVEQVDYVVNYDIPEQAEDYIHRIGRTGRAGKGGFAITFVTPENNAELRAIERLVKKPIPEMKLLDFDIAQAEADAAEAAILAQSKRDPEVNKVRRQLGSEKQQKAEAAEAKQASKGVSSRKPKAMSKSKAAAKPKATAKPRVKPKPKTAVKSITTSKSKVASERNPASEPEAMSRRKATSKPKAAPKSKPMPKEKPVAANTARKAKPSRAEKPARPVRSSKDSTDFRPGRSRRAEVERSRARSKKRR
ncbi:MAG: DEAD/DEAH box helicase [Eggerthellaceae bacterium]|nr:DEAD/DEAH box helicase [Eggerthellaceae bacterium]